MKADEALRALKKIQNSEQARFLKSFFKAIPGGYGEGDQFLGIRVPQVRTLARQFRELPLSELEKLIRSKWHEARLLAVVIFVDQFRKASLSEKPKIFKAYWKSKKYINQWDLVDVSIPHILGSYVQGKSLHTLRKLARSSSLWDRRMSILATFASIRADNTQPTFEIAQILLRDSEDLIHKAVGWMLREAGKKDPEALLRFLEKNMHSMPRTMLRYAIEKFPRETRTRILRQSQTKAKRYAQT